MIFLRIFHRLLPHLINYFYKKKVSSLHLLDCDLHLKYSCAISEVFLYKSQTIYTQLVLSTSRKCLQLYFWENTNRKRPYSYFVYTKRSTIWQWFLIFSLQNVGLHQKLFWIRISYLLKICDKTHMRYAAISFISRRNNQWLLLK